jgi:hypothetical protein
MLALPATAVASHDPSGAPFGEDFVRGQETRLDCLGRECLTVVERIDAHSGPSGENPTGFNDATALGVTFFSASVTCLSVHGNRAVVGLSVPEPNVDRVKFYEDNAGAGIPDRVGLMLTPGGPTSMCPAFPAEGSTVLRPLVSGDIVVHDAPGLPTSKQQCMRKP